MSDVVVALDFDGVVWDSVDEAFEQAYLAWSELNGPPTQSKERLRERFRSARWQCRDGHDFYVVMSLLTKDTAIDIGQMSAQAFRDLRNQLTGESDTFVHHFYESRAQMRQHSFDHWMTLQQPYPGIVEEIRRLQRETRGVAVATTKDGPSAQSLLAAVGLTEIPIFGREVSLDKRDHMTAIAQRYAVDPSQIAFVDDLLENLLPLQPMGVRIALADWGYNTATERDVARRGGVPVVSLVGFADAVQRLYPNGG